MNWVDSLIRPLAKLLLGYFPAVLMLGMVNAALAAWWLSTELLRSHPATAAEIGMIRGDLWLADGIALSATAVPLTANGAQGAIERSLLFAPMNSAAWFALASVTERLNWVSGTASNALKMSYYTGFNDKSLVAARLELLARTDAKGDTELGDILKRQIRLIVTRAPELKPAIVEAYATATPANKSVIEDELQDVDQDLAARLRGR